MMISPATAFEMNLKDQSKEGIEKEIKRIKRRIRETEKEIIQENALPVEEREIVMPSKSTHLWWDEEYLKLLIKKYEEAGGVYKYTKREIKINTIQTALDHLTKLTLHITSYMLPFTLELEVSGDHVIYRHIRFSNVVEEVVEEYDKEDCIDCLKGLKLGGWKKHYKSKDMILDGESWELTVEFSDDTPSLKSSGDNEYPLSYDALYEIFSDKLKTVESRYEYGGYIEYNE